MSGARRHAGAARARVERRVRDGRATIVRSRVGRRETPGARRRETPGARRCDPRGQASILLVGGLAGLLIAAVIAGAVARAVSREAHAQRAADLAAVAAARVMHANYGRLFEPAFIRRVPNPRHLEKGDYLALGRAAALDVARANDAPAASVSFPDGDTIAPIRVHVTVREVVRLGAGRARRRVRIRAEAEAELGPAATTGFAAGGGYDGPLEYRQGEGMRPDVALAFDRMAAAAHADGIALAVNSGYRSDAEQAILWARHPDPKWVARPGTSLHRYATELDLGPPTAYVWLAANAPRFHFIRRYAWEPWHFGLALNAQSTPRTTGDGAAGSSHGAVPGFVPSQYAPMLRTAAQRWNVSATLLAAQIYAESGFNPFARSGAGALGIAQFMPETARGFGIDPLDPAQAIDAQAHFMRDLLRQFGAVPLALAAYNAGPVAVSGCACIPANTETPGYVARVLALMAGAGVPVTGAGAGLAVRLVK